MSSADSAPSSPAADASSGPFARFFPALDEELQKRVDLPAAADEDAIRRAVAERRRLYESRTSPDFPKPVRQQNAMLLTRLDQLAPAFEAHITAVRAWRLLAEASELLDQRAWARCRHRLNDAATLLEKTPHENLRRWSADVRADLEDQATPEPPPPSAVPATPPLAPRPLVLAPPEATGQVGQAFACAFVVHPAGLAATATGLPAGLALDANAGRIAGLPAVAGVFTIELQTVGAGGTATAQIIVRIAPALAAAPPPVSPPTPPPAPSPPPAPPTPPTVAAAPLVQPVAAPPPAQPVGAQDRFTFTLRDGRRVHVFSGPRVRCGRAADGDLPVTCVVRGNPAATVATTKEISRQHCEIVSEGDRVLIHDGWNPDRKPSTFGTFLDVHRVPVSGSPLANGQMLKFTSRAPGPGVAHWRVTVVEQSALRGAPAAFVPALSAGPRVAALWLRRLDDVPDDVLLVQSICDLHALGLSPEPLWLRSGPDGWTVARGTRVAPIAELPALLPGAVPGPAGVVRPHSPQEALQLGARR